MAKNRRKAKMTNARKYQKRHFHEKNKPRRLVDIQKQILNAFIQSEEKKTIKTDKGNTYLRIMMHISKWAYENATTELKDGKLAHPTYWGKTKIIDRYFEKEAERVKNGEITGDYFKKQVHAVQSFKTAVDTTTAFGKRNVKIGDHVKRREHYSEMGVYIKQKEKTAVKTDLKTAWKVHKHIHVEVRNGEETKKLNYFQSLTAARIGAAVDLKVENVKYDENKNCWMVTFHKDKNGFTRTVPLDHLNEKQEEFISSLVHDKSRGQDVFTFKKANGNDMNREEKMKEVQRITRDAAIAASVYKNDSRFNSHSNRKAMAQNIYDIHKNTSKDELWEKIKQYVRLQGGNQVQIWKRINNERKNLYRYRIQSGKNAPHKFDREKLRLLYVSLLLGHSRISVVKDHYLITDNERGKINMTKKRNVTTAV